MAVSKETVRKAILEKRDALSPSQVKAASEAIAQGVRALPIAPLRLCLAYLPTRNEVDTSPLITWLRNNQVEVALPVVMPDRTLQAGLYNNDSSLLHVGAFGILEPDHSKANYVDPLQIDLILVPAVAYDGSGNRLGFGKGYYDRFLASLPRFARRQKTGAGVTPAPTILKPYLVGLAFDFQMVPSLPAEEHDIPVDAVVTESAVFYRGARR